MLLTDCVLVLRTMIKNDSDFLDAFAKLRKVAISFVISVYLLSVRPSVRPHGTNRLLLNGFSWNLIFEYFSKTCRENSNLIRITCTLHEDHCTFLSNLAHFILEWEMFRTKVTKKIKTHILLFNNFHRKSRLLRNNVEKYCTAGDRPCSTCALLVGYLRLQTHTLKTCNP